MGFLGIGGINAPFYVYVSRWFDRRRGSALALISSGGYLAGAIWPLVFERAIAHVGWRQTMLTYGLVEMAIVVPLALIFLRPPPELPYAGAALNLPSNGRRVFGWPPNLVYALMALAMMLCCIPMAIPQAHLPAFCSDLGILPSHGAAMLSVLLGAGFISRQFWGWFSDHIGGLMTVLVGSFFQILAMTAFLLTTDEVGLFTVSLAFGLGFAGIVPAYVLAVRELFPGIRGIVADSHPPAVQRPRHGDRRLARRRAARPFRLLRPGLRRWHRRECAEPAADRHAGVALQVDAPGDGVSPAGSPVSGRGAGCLQRLSSSVWKVPDGIDDAAADHREQRLDAADLVVGTAM